jgi:hypothetical protein
MQRRLAGTAMAVVGITLIGTVVGTQLISRSQAFERLSARTRTSFTAAAVAQGRQDLAALQTVGQQLGTALPALGQQANLTPAQLQAFLAQFPAFTRGVAELPAITQRLSTLTATIDRQRANFASADAIPTPTQSATNVPWFIVMMGLLCVIVGAMLTATSSRMWTVAAAVVGIIIVVVPMATTLPTKGARADTLNDSLRSVYSDQAIAGLRSSAATIAATASSLQTEVLPAVGQKLGVTAQEIQAGVVQFFPTLAEGLATTPQAVERLGRTASALAATRSDFTEVAGTSYEPIAWTVVGGGIVMLLLATFVAIAPTIKEQRLERRTARRLAA